MTVIFHKKERAGEREGEEGREGDGKDDVPKSYLKPWLNGWLDGKSLATPPDHRYKKQKVHFSWARTITTAARTLFGPFFIQGRRKTVGS